MKKFQNVKNILFKMDLEGNGIVNRDSSDQKYVHIFNNTQLRPPFKSGDNLSYAKKNFYETAEGKMSWKLKISSDCLSHAIFGSDAVPYSSKVTLSPVLLYSYYFSAPLLVKGWMNATKSEQLKRKGALSLNDAEQTNNAVSSWEFFSRSGEKIEKDQETGKSNPDIHQKETVGEITYGTSGVIDLMQLQFVACDQGTDRYSFNPDKFDLVKTYLKKRLPSFDSELGHYMIKNTYNEIAEHGFLISEENVIFLVKETLKRMLTLNIRRRNSHAKTSGLRIKLVQDPLIHTEKSEDNWLEIKTIEDIDNLDFGVQYFYDLVDPSEVEAKREMIEEGLTISKSKAKADAEKERKKAAEKKASKGSLTKNVS
jgi:hypothetical protein